jgi:hypothetical protein
MTFRLRNPRYKFALYREDLSVFPAGHLLPTKPPVLPFRVKQNRVPALVCGRFPKTPLPSNHLLAVDLEATTAGYPSALPSPAR